MATSQLHEDFSREEHVKAGTDRGFGLVFAGFFALVSALSWWRGHTGWHWTLPLAVAFWSWPTPIPKVLDPLNRLWLKFGLLLYKVMNPIVLGLLFFVTIMPIGLVMRAMGKDFLRLQARSQGQELLDRSHAAGAAAAIHEKPILISKGPSMGSIIVELWAFMRERKKFWLLPILIMMVIFGGLIVLTKGSAIAPFIYTLF